MEGTQHNLHLYIVDLLFGRRIKSNGTLFPTPHLLQECLKNYQLIRGHLPKYLVETFLPHSTTFFTLANISTWNYCYTYTPYDFINNNKTTSQQFLTSIQRNRILVQHNQQQIYICKSNRTHNDNFADVLVD